MAVAALAFILTGRWKSALVLLVIWAIGMYRTILRMDGNTWGGSRPRPWLIWVVLEHVLCACIVVIGIAAAQ